jgi:uncharacterized membrane protein YhaH (DUF805 family)
VVYDTASDAPPFWGLGFSGRMGRVNYLLSGIAFLGLFGLLGIVAAVLIPLTSSVLLGVLLVPALIALLVFGVRSMVLRLHDVNRSGWWTVILFLALLPGATASRHPSAATLTAMLVLSGFNVLATVALLIYPGTDGDNDFGEPARPGNGVLAIVLLLATVLLFAFSISYTSRKYGEYAARARDQGHPQADDDDESSPDTSRAGPPPPAQVQAAAQRISSESGRTAFLQEYLPARQYKAFATSDSGAWGWSYGKKSPREAVMSALAQCEQHRQPYTGPCVPININGAWIEERR